MTVLVLTEDHDPSVDQVITTLGNRDIPVFRAELGWFPQRLTLDAELRGSYWVGVLRTPERETRLESLRSVWYRRPTAFTFPDTMSRARREHAEREARFGLGGVLSALPVKWVNHPRRDAGAAYKPHQLALAAQCGLDVPRSLVTNDPDLADLSGVELTTHQFQEWVPKKYDVRLIAVGTELFAVGIHTQAPEAHIDWRANYEALDYSVVDIPSPLADGIRAFMSASGLNFSAFDFVITPDDRWLFLESNSTGQYGWLAQVLGTAVSDAMARLLAQGEL